MRVLLLEDVVSLSRVYELVLEDEGHDVSVGHNGIDGLEYIDSGIIFGAIVTDYSMPKMNGREFIDAVRDREIMTPMMLHTADPRNMFTPHHKNLEVCYKESDFDYIKDFVLRVQNGAYNGGK